MQCSSSLHSYPHINRRNIPDIFELQRMRETINRIEGYLQDIQPKLEDARRRLDNLRRSYKDEDVTYDQPESYIEHVSKLRLYEAHITRHEEALLQGAATLKSFRSPVHSIRRCPTDMLRLIFEWVLIDHPDPCAKRLWPATLLSQVCYRWRGIALCMPQLWTYLDISLKRSADDVEAYWSRTVERVRMCPVVIHIKGLTLSDETRAAMEKCRLNLIPCIAFLTFSFNQASDLEALRTCHFHPPADEIYTLDIRASCDNSRNFSALSNLSDPRSSPSLSDPLQFLGRFSGFRRLRLTDFNLSSHAVGFTIPHVSHLSFTNCENVALNVLSKTFPDAEKVTFVNCKSFSHHGEDIKWDRVTRLQVDKSDGLPWERLNLPQIQSLSLLISEIFTEAVSPVFLKSHPSLQELHCINLFNEFSDIAKAAPQLTKISMPASEAKSALQFRNLDYLYLFQNLNSDLGTEVLEAIIERHFPPSNKLEKQTDCLVASPLGDYGVTGRNFSIFMPIGSIFDCTWRISPSILRKEERTAKAIVWAQKYNVYSYI